MHGGQAGRSASWLWSALVLGLASSIAWWPWGNSSRWATYILVEVLGLALAWPLTRRRRPPLGWVILLGGISCNVLADILYFRETVILAMGAQASWSDLAYLLAYLPMAIGLILMGRRVDRGAGALLDASIFAVGLAIPVVAFYVLPVAKQQVIGINGVLLVGWYALGSILVFALYVQQITSLRSHNPAFLLLGASLLAAAIGDPLWNVHMMTGRSAFEELPKALWFVSRALPLAALLHPSFPELWREPADRPLNPLPRLRLVALTLGALMPALTLLLAQFAPRGYPYWTAVVAGGLLLPVLVLARMDGLLQQLRGQTRQLDMLSHYDELTGAPNRRQWKKALSQVMSPARKASRPVVIGLLDLDHFKMFNDTHGHHAGDDLLREAHQAWSNRLPPSAVLARYGGEEFALLLPDANLAQARELLFQMQRATPRQQTFSAGLVACRTGDKLDNALDFADIALYGAKQDGRNCVHQFLSDAPGKTRLLPLAPEAMPAPR